MRVGFNMDTYRELCLIINDFMYLCVLDFFPKLFKGLESDVDRETPNLLLVVELNLLNGN